MESSAFEKEYMSRFNAQQRKAVRQVDGPILLLAVPGSGKTTVLVTRLGYMALCCEIKPEEILTVTYTVAATGDIGQGAQSISEKIWQSNLNFGRLTASAPRSSNITEGNTTEALLPW